MALFDLLGDSDLNYTAVGGGYSQLASDLLGDELTDADGFAELLNGALMALPDDDNAFTAFDNLVAAADFADGEFDSEVLDGVTELVAQFEDADIDLPDL